MKRHQQRNYHMPGAEAGLSAGLCASTVGTSSSFLGDDVIARRLYRIRIGASALDGANHFFRV